jgi:hypothetical protein
MPQTQTALSESLKLKKRLGVSLQIIEDMSHLLLKLVVSLSGRHQGTYLVFKSHALGVVLVNPSLRGFPAVEDLEVLGISDLLAGVDIDPDCHRTILATQ